MMHCGVFLMTGNPETTQLEPIVCTNLGMEDSVNPASFFGGHVAHGTAPIRKLLLRPLDILQLANMFLFANKQNVNK